MGMFDYVGYVGPCPDCGKRVDDFQSKDGPCTLSMVSPLEVFEFNSACDHCGAWIEYRRKPAESMNDFECVVESKDAPKVGD